MLGPPLPTEILDDLDTLRGRPLQPEGAIGRLLLLEGVELADANLHRRILSRPCPFPTGFAPERTGSVQRALVSPTGTNGSQTLPWLVPVEGWIAV
jgi:hypothetical protein